MPTIIYIPCTIPYHHTVYGFGSYPLHIALYNDSAVDDSCWGSACPTWKFFETAIKNEHRQCLMAMDDDDDVTSIPGSH